MTTAEAALDKNAIQAEMRAMGRAAREAAALLARSDAATRDAALIAAAKALRASQEEILAANAKDMEEAKAKGLSEALLDRLLLNPERVEAMAAGLEAIAEQEDPLGRVIELRERPNGLKIEKVTVPLGVIGIIYESRPNVTADAGALCIKSGNAAILRGGSESYHSSGAILSCLKKGLADAGLPESSIQRPGTTDREAVGMMLTMNDCIDVIIPRGGKGLTGRVMNESKVPVLAHLDGNCHTYVHAAADPEMAKAIVHNAKLRRTGICGATETLLLDEALADSQLVPILEDLSAAGCEIRGDAGVCARFPAAKPASEEDWDTEYLAPIIAVRLVPGLEEAVAHINRHGSHHTEAIVTEDEAAAERFMAEVDAGIVLHNASTQYADGGEFGMGAEIGISTGKLHARGPVGAQQLTSTKYRVRGSGQVRP